VLSLAVVLLAALAYKAGAGDVASAAARQCDGRARFGARFGPTVLAGRLCAGHDGGAGDDSLNGGILADNLIGGADNDTLNIFGTNAADELNVKEDTGLGGSFRTTITGGRMGRVNYIAPTPSNARLTTLNVHGLDGQDTFFVSPSRYFTINIFGGTPSFGPGAGDVLAQVG
jgi:hypothetical protein